MKSLKAWLSGCRDRLEPRAARDWGTSLEEVDEEASSDRLSSAGEIDVIGGIIPPSTPCWCGEENVKTTDVDQPCSSAGKRTPT